MTALSLLSLLGGFALLALGAELLVRGAVSLAALARVPPALVGLTLVAFGTSVPELAVCLDAAARGEPGIALGNVVGSNICNVLLILGASALSAPLWVPEALIRFDLPLLCGVSVATLFCAIDGSVSRIQGACLLLGLIGWCAFELVGAQSGRVIARRTEQIRRKPAPSAAPRAILLALGAAAIGLLGVLGGASLSVSGATSVARAFGLSDTVIGLTILSIGTALPELATSIAAALRGQGELAVGNVIGSNLFNLLGVLGAAAVGSRAGIPVPHGALIFDIPVMLVSTLFCIPILRSERTVSRAEGAALLVSYAAYLALRFQSAT